ncbi:glycerophosphodiester transporter [Schizosaccharomyces japonicus yFS275]|uniref:Glycerophosphodiester transporter n=1 Tax=Schizosaccharomyces japonicus (strain yFS275 / FY16936) TaxID=402676 RepID=B6K4T1_SCHJY|nr:glycerophosphodiester transporter [Schizosaccharomyces japonicus yFS275]EEB08488.1 glycerophosphodiester transporter [Schizosaccharomyces japonicus yFS275]
MTTKDPTKEDPTSTTVTFFDDLHHSSSSESANKPDDLSKDSVEVTAVPGTAVSTGEEPSELRKFWVVFVCGVALVSDGYCGNTIGTVITILKKLYPTETAHSSALKNVGMIAYVGTLVGQLTFGYISDQIGRKRGMITATIILIVSIALCAGAYGNHGSIKGMITALIVYRFFLGIGIGAEYPCGSVAASESTAEMKSGQRHAVFISVTNLALVTGSILGVLIPFILTSILGDNRLRIVWRLSIGLGVIIPIFLLFFRFRIKESKSYIRYRLHYSKIPWHIVLQMYGWRLVTLCIIWFVYDLSACAFGLYVSTIVKGVLPNNTSMAKTFGWSTVINTFYLPGTIIGAFCSDWIGPKYCLVVGLVLQGVIGFFMSGFYSDLVKHIAGFCVIYGLFLSLGNFGPGNNIGLLAAKTSPACFRGLYYGISAAIGKCGAIAGVYAFGGNAIRTYFFIASALAIVVAILTYFFVPNVRQTCIEDEDTRFARVCQENGYNVFDFTEQIRVGPNKSSA